MRNLTAVSVSFALALLAAIFAVSGARATDSDYASAVTYQINRAHSGAQDDPFLRPPLNPRWSRTFASSISYPLIAGGKVFVTVRNVSQYGTTIHALDRATGATVWTRAIPGTYYWSNAAYEAGRVFVLNFDGVLQALSARDGGTIWVRQLPGQYAFSSPPVVSDGVVYTGGAGSGGTLYAVDAATGQVRWMRSVANGDHSSPAVSDSSVFVAYAGPQVYAFRRGDGMQLWHYDSGISGGGGRTTVLAPGGLLFARDTFGGGWVFNAKTGALVDSFGSVTAPAFWDHTGLFLYNGLLEARDITSGGLLWSFAGDGGLVSAPIVVRSSAGIHVYVGSMSGMLYALDLTDGTVDWSTDVGPGILGPDEHNVSSPLTGLAAGQGLLVVPAGNVLLAYGD